MQDGGTADPGAEMLGVLGQDAECLVGGVKQSVVKPPLIGPDKRMESVREREDDMEVRDWKKFPGASFEPLLLVEGLALGAMAIAASNGELSITCVMGSDL